MNIVGLFRVTEITLRDLTVGVERVTLTNDEGRYQIAGVPVGNYQLQVRSSGFQAQIVENVRVEVGRRLTYDFRLHLGEISEQVIIPTDGELIERSTTSVGHVVDQKVVQDVPLNGRYFLDLGLLVPGSVTPPQKGFTTAPSRGVGGQAINTGGNREDTVNYMVNGMTLNNLVFSSVTFQPSIDTVQEFKVDNSTFSAEYGQSSGAVVNIATRSGGNDFHGELFEFLRNDVFDARNFFSLTSSQPPPFKRNQFGGHLGGPIIKNKTLRGEHHDAKQWYTNGWRAGRKERPYPSIPRECFRI